MKRLGSSLALALLLLLSNPSFPQWERDELPDGSESCLNTETGERILLETRAGNWASRDCSAFTLFVDWLQTAEAALSLGSIVQNVDGTINAQYPDGSKPPAAATLTWNLATIDPVESLVTGVAYSDDVRACCLSGTAAATAVITLTDTTGAQCGDWSISMSDNLVNAGSNAGSCSFRLRATDSGQSANSAPLNAFYSAAPSIDALAPPVPTGLRVSGTDTNQITIEFDPTCDNHDGTEAASGTKQYNIRLDASPVETFAGSACSNAAFTQNIIGSSDGTPSSTQSGNNWDLSFAGTGLNSSSGVDNLLTRGTSVAGDAWVSAQATDLVSSNDFAKVGPYITASEASGTVGCWIHQQSNSSLTPAFHAQMRCRATDSASLIPSATFTTGGLQNPWLALSRTQSTNQVCGYYSSNGGEWSLGGCETIVLPTTVRSGCYITGQNGSSNDATGSCDNLNVHALPKVSRNIATMTGGVIDVSVDDNDDNESAFSTSVSGTPGATPGENVNWNPGSYLLSTVNQSDVSDQSARFTVYNAHASNTALKGFAFYVAWGELEPTDDNFNFDYLQAEIDHAKNLSVPKYVWVRLTPQIYGGPGSLSCASGNENFPQWVIDIGGCSSTTNQAIVTFWDADVTTEYIELVSQMCTFFANEEYLAGITLTRETAFGSPLPEGYSVSSYVAQLERLATESRAACPGIPLVMNINFLTSGQGGVNSLVQAMIDAEVGIGGPDLAPSGCAVEGACTSTQWDAVTQGIWAYNSINALSGGEVPIVYSQESSEMGLDSVGRNGGYLPSQAADFCLNYLGCNIILFNYNTFAESANAPCDSSGDCRWPAVLTWINANPSYLLATCPSAYAGCD